MCYANYSMFFLRKTFTFLSMKLKSASLGLVFLYVDLFIAELFSTLMNFPLLIFEAELTTLRPLKKVSNYVQSGWILNFPFVLCTWSINRD